MRSSYRRRDDRTTPIALWLFLVAAMVVAMVVVGGATRLTDSGLSITEWRPVSGALPPMNASDWEDEFANYRRIPQFHQMNPDMTVSQFKTIYWWEWSHRQLGRLIGLVFAVPFLFFLLRRMMPRRLIWRCVVLLGLGGLQGAAGWWMVSSGLADRISVAPERLTVHLGLALILLAALIWTGLEALVGKHRGGYGGPWARGAIAIVILVFIQSLLGALVAANDAGRIYNDWPLMNGALLPDNYATGGLWQIIAHNQGSVQLHHRLMGYLIFVVMAAFIASASATRNLSPGVKRGAIVLGVMGLAQVALGIVTLIALAPLWLGMLHQLLATILFATAVWLAWRARRD